MTVWDDKETWWRALFARSAPINIAMPMRDLHARLLTLEGRFDELRELQSIEEAFLAEEQAEADTAIAKKKTRWFWQKPSS